MLQCILLCLVYALTPGRAHSLIAVPSLSLPDEIISTLGEGTFGRVVQCIDHRRYVCCWNGEGGGKGDCSWRWSVACVAWEPGGQDASLRFQFSSVALDTHPLGSSVCWEEPQGCLCGGKRLCFGGQLLTAAVWLEQGWWEAVLCGVSLLQRGLLAGHELSDPAQG